MTALARAADPDGIRPWMGPYRRAWMRGMTDRQIAERHGVSRTTVRDWRNRAGLAPHAGTRPPLSAAQRAAFTTENRARAGKAAARTSAHALAVLDSGATLTARDRAVLEARAADPWASLAELAAGLDMSKDQFSGALRRVLTLHPVTGP